VTSPVPPPGLASAPPRSVRGWFGSLHRLLVGIVDRHPRLGFYLYPPYLGTGIRVAEMSPDARSIVVEMPLRPYNVNYFGNHFGGSLYAMCDPFLVFMAVRNLGPDYTVFDKGASIRFRRPGRGTVRVRFVLTEERLAAIRAAVDRDGRTDQTFTVDVRDRMGVVVAVVEKTLQVRRRR
jgi:acyl-coenzyme A thioesterase PaaI-like protein